MSNTTHVIGEDIVTISEALKRLENKAPARQSFHAAVTNGKIQKAPDTPNCSDGKIRVFWTSVQAYIASGGFKSREKSNSVTESKTESASPATGQVVPEIPTDRFTAEADLQNPQPIASPLTHSSTNVEKRSPGQTSGKPPHLKTPNHFDGKRKSAPQHERAMPKGQVNPVSPEKSKARNAPSLRVLKNSLRHLDFEQTKAIRDWADNRLFNVLHPAPLQASSEVDSKNPQHA
jgi:hypothetical protein